MKILNLKLKNINSLSDENEIDFTDPVFTNDGLFAITGKTGSGKSSILDAISLAFYGKTPRVNISGNENAIMTRGEKDCYSEVVFEVGGKKYKSSWKQECTRTGKLKAVKRIIADANNKIIADQVRTCDKKIIEIIGLTFEQFTKVVMLAQGSFTAFLQADKNDKGELLEQITGTEIYGEMSKSVFERNKIEQEKLEKIKIKLEAIKILSEDELKTLNNEIRACEEEKKKVDKNLQNLEKEKKWLDDIEKLKTQIKEAKQKLPELEEAAKQATKVLEKAKQQSIKAKKEQEKQEPIFKKVRVLDTKTAEKYKLLQPIYNKISELEKIKKELSDNSKNQNSNLEQSKKLLFKKQKWASENKKYEELVLNYTAITKENQLLTEAAKEINKLKAEINDLEKKLNAEKNQNEKNSKKFSDIEQKLTIKTNILKTKKAELQELLNGKDISQIQEEKENLSNFILHIKNLISIEKAIDSNQKEIKAIDIKLNQFEKTNTSLQKSLEDDKKKQAGLDNQIKLHEENINLTKTIQNLEAHRHNLKDGEPCPLCGALEHPFALGNIPQIGEKEKELAELKQELQNITKSIQQNEKILATLNSDQKNNKDNKVKVKKSLNENEKKKEEILSEIKSINANFSVSVDEDKIEQLNEILTEKQLKLKEIDKLVRQANAEEKEIENLRDKEIPKWQKEKEQAQKTKTDAETSLKLMAQQSEEKQKSIYDKESKYKTDYTTFINTLKSYNAKNINELKEHLEDWEKINKQTEELKDKISQLNKNISLTENELKNQKQQLSDKQNEKQEIESEKQKLTAERIELFGTKSVEKEETRLNEMIEKLVEAEKKAEEENKKIFVELAENKAVIAEKEITLSKEKKKKITEKTIVEIEADIVEKNKIANSLSEEIGAKNQIIITNDKNFKDVESKLKEKNKQQKIWNKWGNLNELIGSSDGKKYRNFAQALTFEYLIGLSNKQLQKMSERYILKRTGDSNNPFELSVIDKFQNSEERTVQNLSGGEKFIVSLSLALGLANMASKNMRVDTMFIDEGFGTLDSDYLDVALNALANLQSEGKIIGVISHLTELKERIATHIEIASSGNGHSQIQITN